MNSVNEEKNPSGVPTESPRPALESGRPTILECFSCAGDDCGLNAELACGYDECDNEPRYCRRHLISHLAGTHPIAERCFQRRPAKTARWSF